jgi:hypothetical protein
LTSIWCFCQYRAHNSRFFGPPFDYENCPEIWKMRKSLWIILAVLLVAIVAPIAHADETPSGLLVFGCPSCTGSVSFGAGGTAPFVGSGIDLTLTSATNPGSPDLVGDEFALAFNTNTGAISLTEVTGGGGFNLSGTLTTFACTLVGTTDSCPVAATFFGLGTGSGTVTFVTVTGPFGVAGSVLSADMNVTIPSPEPSSVGLLLVGTGLLLLIRKRIGQGLPQAS